MLKKVNTPQRFIFSPVCTKKNKLYVCFIELHIESDNSKENRRKCESETISMIVFQWVSSALLFACISDEIIIIIVIVIIIMAKRSRWKKRELCGYRFAYFDFEYVPPFPPLFRTRHFHFCFRCVFFRRLKIRRVSSICRVQFRAFSFQERTRPGKKYGENFKQIENSVELQFVSKEKNRGRR